MNSSYNYKYTVYVKNLTIKHRIDFLFFLIIIILFLEELLWVAPELLAEHITNLIPATQKGDVYSFAIVLEEIVVRGGPYEFVKNDLTTQGKLFSSVL